MAYTDKGRIQRYLNVDIASSYDSQITDWIAEVKDWIDTYCGKTFEAAADTRYFDGIGTKEVIVDAFVAGTITALNILNINGSAESALTEGHSNDYIAYPLNSGEQHMLRMTANSARSVFPARKRTVELTADFGHSAIVPNAVRSVATKLVAMLVDKGLKGGKLSEVALGDYRAKFEAIDEDFAAMGIYQTLDMFRDIEL